MKQRSKKGDKIIKGMPSAVVLSIAIHAGLFLLAGMLVVFTVVKKEEPKFVPPKAVERPKMKLRKPKVKVKKSTKPKPTTRIVTKMTRAAMPDIQLPEMTGMTAGFGGGIGGFDLMPDLDQTTVFGSGQSIGNDFVGTFYDLKRDRTGRDIPMDPDMYLKALRDFVVSGWKSSELAKYYQSPKKLYATTFMIPTILSSVAPANTANVDKVEKWLAPLNKVSMGMAADDFGPKTLGPGGHRISEDFRTGKIQQNRSWYPPCAEAMKQQADTVFLLTSIFGYQWDPGKRIPMSKSAERKWEESYQKALKLLDEDNANRLAKGEGPRAINKNSKWEVNKAYFPDIEFPQQEESYWYTANDFRKAFSTIRTKSQPAATRATSEISKKKKNNFTLNIVQFVPDRDAGEFQYRYDRSVPKLKGLANRLNGQYRTIKGMEGIKSSVGH